MKLVTSMLAPSLLLLLGPASALTLESSPKSLDDGQGVVIKIVDDGGSQFVPSHLNAVLASCDRTSILQRVPHRSAAVAAPCEGRASQKWALSDASDEAYPLGGRFVSMLQGEGGAGERCLDASCFETESSGLFEGDLSLCPDQKRDLHGVDWCHKGLDEAGLGFTTNEPHAQEWSFLPGTNLLRSGYDGLCLENRGVVLGTGLYGDDGGDGKQQASALGLFECDATNAAQAFAYNSSTGELLSLVGGLCVTVDEEGILSQGPAVGSEGAVAASVRFGTLPALRCDFKFTLVQVVDPPSDGDHAGKALSQVDYMYAPAGLASTAAAAAAAGDGGTGGGGKVPLHSSLATNRVTLLPPTDRQPQHASKSKERLVDGGSGAGLFDALDLGVGPGFLGGLSELSKPLVVRSRKGPNAPRFLRASLGDPDTNSSTGRGGRGVWVSWTSNSNRGVATVEYEYVRAPAFADNAEDEEDEVEMYSTPDLVDVRLRLRKAFGDSVTYSSADMCEAPANIAHDPWGTTDPGWQHHVLLPSLPRGLRAIKYRVGLTYPRNESSASSPSAAASADNEVDNEADNEVEGGEGRGPLGGWSKVRELVLPPPPPPLNNAESASSSSSSNQIKTKKTGKKAKKGAVTFIGFGDMGAEAAQQASATVSWALRDVLDHGASFVLHFGDLAYGCGITLIWDAWSALIEPLSSRVPYLVSLGNHELVWSQSYYTGSASGGECGVPTVQRFRSPSNGSGKKGAATNREGSGSSGALERSGVDVASSSVLWYSFDSGAVHVVTLSTEHDVTPGSLQHSWLESDLASVNREETPWIVLTAHRMLYTTQLCEDGDFDRSLELRAALEPLLLAYRVNLVLVGHQHSYERTCPIASNATCASSASSAFGTVHAVVGSAGASLESCGFSDLLNSDNNNSTGSNIFDVAHANMWGYARMTADSESFRFQFISNIDGSVYDEVGLIKYDA